MRDQHRGRESAIGRRSMVRRETCVCRSARARRLIGSIPVLLIVIVGTFLLLEAAPGDAVDAYLVSTGGDAGLIAAAAPALGARPVAAGPARHLSVVAHPSRSRLFGRLLPADPRRHPRAAAQHAAADGQRDRACRSASARCSASVAGARPGSFRDRLLSIGSLALYAVPGFWLGLVLTVIFSVQLRWLPLCGHRDHRVRQDRLRARARHRPAISCCRSRRSASSTSRSTCA